MPDIIPALARGTFHDRLWANPNWIAEEKYDGERRIVQFVEGQGHFTGRPSRTTGHVVEKSAQVPHLSCIRVDAPMGSCVPWTEISPALAGTVLDGELIFVGKCAMGGRSKLVTSIANSSPAEAVAKQCERGWLRYVVFDCLFWQGQDVRARSYLDRRALAIRAVKAWCNDFVQISEMVTANKERFLKAILARGGEGVILKNKAAAYGDRQAWVKYKAEWTADAIITGYKAAKEQSRKVDGTVSATKYAGKRMIGSVIVAQYEDGKLREVADISGMRETLRAALSRHGRTYIGRVVELKHNGREASGRFRHPRFVRFREDKQAEECVYRPGSQE